MDKAVEPELALAAAAGETPDVGADAEAAYEKFVWDNLRRNYAGHYLHGMLGMTGFRLVNAPTFIPAYVHMLSGSDAIVGLALALQQLGGILSPLFGASHIEHRKRVLPVAMILGTGMRVPILAIAIFGWLWGGKTPILGAQPQALLWAVLGSLFVMGVFSGAQRVAFQLLLAKVIPIARRGRLQAWRNVTGGVIAAALSYFAGRWFIESNVLGNGYSTTFLLAFVLTSLGLTALRLLMREPEPPTVRTQTRLRERMKDFPALLRGDRDYLFFMCAQLLAVAARVGAPFYILFASQTVQLTGANIGLLSLAYLGADTATNLGWGYTGDKFGFRATFIGSLFVWIGAIVLLLNAHDMPSVFIAFFGLGAAQSGYMMSSSTMVLEFGARDDIAMRLALSTTVEGFISTIGPLAGGLLAATVGYPVLFSVSIGFLVVSLMLLIGVVKEPRNRRLKT